MSYESLIDFFVAAAFGATIGAGELVSRYRDEPARALWTFPAALYLLINALASLAALWLIREVGLVRAPTLDEKGARWTQVLIAGFGSIVFFRSSVFTARVDGRDVAIGPAQFLQAFLRAIDQAVDRNRALARDAIVSRVMRDVSFERAATVLPAHCLGLLKNTTKEEQAELGHAVERIRKGDLPDRARSRLLGLALMNLVGEALLTCAVKT